MRSLLLALLLLLQHAACFHPSAPRRASRRIPSRLAAEPPRDPKPPSVLDELRDAGPALVNPFSLEAAVSLGATVAAFVVISKVGVVAAGILTPEMSMEQVQAFGQTPELSAPAPTPPPILAPPEPVAPPEVVEQQSEPVTQPQSVEQ